MYVFCTPEKYHTNIKYVNPHFNRLMGGGKVGPIMPKVNSSTNTQHLYLFTLHLFITPKNMEHMNLYNKPVT